ncbi:Ion_channel domain-containing protein [Hexamita inflata]|uniref:Ion channel domain-containing protein n=1 Tax=Hexamita inflata TaxID=28002 RepID=A0AA86UWV2_9EUKA|nr:Ion channel domain-containing protein [Hexamita inflata]CAI9971214.1 Ion channel domain-containing protein [Hexamita inflata]CAI9975976.1 Ion channel domain-containing protein [Hexamita inflata]
MSKEEQNVITRTDLFDTLNRLEARVHGLSKLIEARMAEQNEDAGDNEQFFKCGRSSVLTYYANALFRNNSLTFTFCYTLVVMGILLLLQAFYVSFAALRAILIFFTIITLCLIVMMCLVSVEQIIRLIHRTARLKTMTTLYLSLVFLYALTYTFYEIIDPGHFNGIDQTFYSGLFRPLQMFVDFLYFSNVCQASVGFGDVSPTSGYGRLTTFSQSLISVAFLSILFSNWIS